MGAGLAVFGFWGSFAAEWQDDFSADPRERGWQWLGDARNFVWNQSEPWVRVTWDSSRENSYLYLPLGTILTREDDFSFAFDLWADALSVGVDPAKPYTFQLALGLINRAHATSTNFFRGAGLNAQYGPRNLIEFSYFPDSGFGETFAPTVVSTNNRIVFSDNHPLALTLGDRFRIGMAYTAADAVVRTSVTRNGDPFGLPPDQRLLDLPLPADFDFRVDGFAICSYNDGHQFPAMFAGSILAEGRVDNVVVLAPDPPVQNLRGLWVGAQWEVAYDGRVGWYYYLERTADLRHWEVVDGREGEDGRRTMADDAPPAAGAVFYRIRAER